jgi:hypothetical protein
MLNIKKATQLAEEYVNKQSKEHNLVLLYEHTIEFESGWVFFYQTKEYTETRDISKMIADNAPFIIDREDGSLHITGTDLPIEKYIRDYVRGKGDF